MTKQQEITRLEGLCEARTKELKVTKLRMKQNLKAFDAMSALVKYLSHDVSFKKYLHTTVIYKLPELIVTKIDIPHTSKKHALKLNMITTGSLMCTHFP